ncbi:biliverdin-producing heme oxygenase [Arcticibacter sp. MXS-1]|uniref:biliverdin-producing heme oxygenase n=1 Tax=Arcticibacter sp. MXS-1 TaxID=3341726 RepID=UPI0035A915A0
MLSSVLKENTLASHQSLEKVLIAKLKNIKSEENYASVLEIFYGFIAPLEEKIRQTEIAVVLPDYSSRRTAEWIANDLELLGVQAADVPLCRELPGVVNTFQALGALYVLEGSTLGGQVIKKMIADRLPGLSPSALSFFGSYNERTAEMWDRFRQVLNSVSNNSKDVEEAAVETFTEFKNWMIRNEQKEL